MEIQVLKLCKYIACICEGSAEKAIINILLDNDLCVFKKNDLIEQELLSCRSAKEFEELYLRKSFDDKISVVRVLDSRKEVFKLSKAYKDKVQVINIITAPEIEVLIILREGKYQDFKKSKLKPSIYCKQFLRMTNVKRYDFVTDYFSDVSVLVNVLKQYKNLSNIPKDELTLSDLLIN